MRTSRSLATAAALTLALGGFTGLAPAAHAEAPLNDEPTTATIVQGVPFSDTTSTAAATTSEQDGCGIATVWYSYTPEADERVVVTSTGLDVDTVLGMHVQAEDGLYEQQCLDVNGSTNDETLPATLSAGTTYLFSVGTCCEASPGEVGPGGQVDFRIEPGPAVVTDVEAQVSTATVARDGTVTVTGTVQCDQPATADLYLSVKQTVGRLIGYGEGYAHLSCGPVPSSFTAQLQSWGPVKLGAGKMTLSGSMSAWDSWTYVWEQLTPRTLKVTGGKAGRA